MTNMPNQPAPQDRPCPHTGFKFFQFVKGKMDTYPVTCGAISGGSPALIFALLSAKIDPHNSPLLKCMILIAWETSLVALGFLALQKLGAFTPVEECPSCLKKERLDWMYQRSPVPPARLRQPSRPVNNDVDPDDERLGANRTVANRAN